MFSISNLFMTISDITQSDCPSYINHKKMGIISQRVTHSSRITFPLYTNPEVSIIIPVWNRPDLIEACLFSIVKNTKGDYEVIVVDNNSDESTKRVLSSFRNLKIITNTENKWFVEGCNQGSEAARGQYLLFLNSDTEVTPGWLDSLVQVAETYPRCGAVGAKLVRLDGSLQEAGSIIWNDGSVSAYGRDDKPEKSQYCYLREVDFCSGACLLVRKDIFSKLGGFDPRYSPAYYEDADFCMTLRQNGYCVLYQPAAVIKHHEFGSSTSDKAISMMEKNHLIFNKKWYQVLQSQCSHGDENLWRACDRRMGKTILFTDDRIPTPDQGMGYPRSYKMICALANLGYRVTLYTLQDSSPYEVHKVLQQKGVEVILGTHLDFERFVCERGGYYYVVIVSRPENMRQIKYVIRKHMSEACVIYDAEAIFALREYLKDRIKGRRFTIIRSYFRRLRELALADSAHAVIAVSDLEAKHFSSIVGEENTHVWGYSVATRKSCQCFDDRKGLLFVGGGMFPGFPNEDAIVHFVDNIFPKVSETLQCKLYIVGNVSSKRVLALDSSDVIVAGYVDDLNRYYDRSRVFVAPSRFSAGIPLKVYEAMANGIPCVVTSMLAKQIRAPDDALLSADTPEEFAQQIIRLYTNSDLWKRIQSAATSYINRECNPKAMTCKLHNIIEYATEAKK